MKSMILAAVVAMGLTAGVAQLAQAAPYSATQTTRQAGSDNGPSLMGGGG